MLYQHHHFRNPRTTMMPLSLNFSCFVNRAASSGAHGSICRKYLGGTEKESCFFLPLSSQKSRGKKPTSLCVPCILVTKMVPSFSLTWMAVARCCASRVGAEREGCGRWARRKQKRQQSPPLALSLSLQSLSPSVQSLSLYSLSFCTVSLQSSLFARRFGSSWCLLVVLI